MFRKVRRRLLILTLKSLAAIEHGGMAMRLHKNPDDFADLIRITSEYLGLDPTIVEKD